MYQSVGRYDVTVSHRPGVGSVRLAAIFVPVSRGHAPIARASRPRASQSTRLDRTEPNHQPVPGNPRNGSWDKDVQGNYRPDWPARIAESTSRTCLRANPTSAVFFKI